MKNGLIGKKEDSMKRFAGLLASLIIIAFTSGCVTCPCGSGAKSAIQHTVVFWLKDHGNIEQQARIIKAAKDLTRIPGVVGVKVGTVLPSDRPVVDSSYDVAMVFSFVSKQALNDYEVHPLHKKAVEEVIKPIVSKIVVYDFVEK